MDDFVLTWLNNFTNKCTNIYLSQGHHLSWLTLSRKRHGHPGFLHVGDLHTDQGDLMCGFGDKDRFRTAGGTHGDIYILDQMGQYAETSRYVHTWA